MSWDRASTWSSCEPYGKARSSVRKSSSHRASRGRNTLPDSIRSEEALMRTTLSPSVLIAIEYTPSRLRSWLRLIPEPLSSIKTTPAFQRRFSSTMRRFRAGYSRRSREDVDLVPGDERGDANRIVRQLLRFGGGVPALHDPVVEPLRRKVVVGRKPPPFNEVAARRDRLLLVLRREGRRSHRGDRWNDGLRRRMRGGAKGNRTANPSLRMSGPGACEMTLKS